MTTLTQDRLGRLRSALEQRAAVLRGEIAEVVDERTDELTTERETVEDAGEHGEQFRQDEVRDAEEGRDAAELREIEAALARMDEGRYGTCVDCGRDIGWARLQAQPTAMRCVQCQRRYEEEAPQRRQQEQTPQ